MRRSHTLALLLLGFALSQASATVFHGFETPTKIREILAEGENPPMPPLAADNIRLIDYPVTSLPPASNEPEAGQPAPALVIRLSEASFCPAVSSPQGYSSYIEDKLAYGNAQIAAGASYRYGGAGGNANGLWDIIFDRIPGYDSLPEPRPEGKEDNFDAADIENAVAAARDAIRASPFDKRAYALLIQARYESMVPLTYAGNEFRAAADKMRVDEVGTITQRYNARIALLGSARDCYRDACYQFLAMINDPDESRFYWAGAGHVGEERPAWADYSTYEAEPGIFRRTPGSQIWSTLVLDAYLQAVELLADVQLSLLSSEYLNEYRTIDVVANQTAIDALVPLCVDAADEIDLLMIPARAAARHYGVESDLENLGYASQSATLRRLAGVIQQRALFFGTSEDQAGNNRINYSAYGPYDIPFLIPAQLQNTPFTFDNIVGYLFGLASNGMVPPGGSSSVAKEGSGSLIGTAIQSDQSVAALVDQTEAAVEDFANVREEARQSYEGQLIDLCGGRRDSSGDLSPDIVGCFLPPGERPLANPTLLESDGAIGQAWLKLESSETRLRLAHRALDEIADEAAIIEELGEEKIDSFRRIIDIQLSTGEKISALDYQAGTIRANTINSVAKEKQKAAKRRGWFKGLSGALGKFAVRGLAAMVTGGASEVFAQAKDAWKMVKTAATVVKAVANPSAEQLQQIANVKNAREGVGGLLGNVGDVASGYMEAQSIGKIAQLQADEARQLAHIDAQRTKIRAMEAASITEENLTQQEILIRERVRLLMVKVERQQLEILLAEQNVTLAEVELANLVGKIGYLMQEYYKASSRIESSTKNRPDIRFRRDHAIREAEAVFRNAQEHAYLAARAAFYRFYMTTSPTSSNERPFVAAIRQATTNILRAQNGMDLQKEVQNLLQARTDFLAATNGLTNLGYVQISVRDHLVQNNHINVSAYRDEDGKMLPSAPQKELLQPFPISTIGSQPPGTEEPTLEALSLAHFRNYLSDPQRLVPLDDGSKKLSIPFSLNFTKQTDKMGNPLRAATVGTFGQVIWGPGAAIDGNGVGVFVNFRGVSGNSGQRAELVVLRSTGAVTMLARPPASSTSNLGASFVRQFSAFNLKASSQISALYSQDVSNPLLWGTIPGINMNWGNQLHERSPANDLWVLEITAPNTTWTNIINNITDIELCMTVLGWRHQ